MKNLDLIITVDTAIAHLAGALGCTVWLLLPYATDWRWIHGRTDSPWYPTMKIFKQSVPFDWQEVIKSISDELEKTQINN
jgi:ADP-heptose:LPS heptosyltransferase